MNDRDVYDYALEKEKECVEKNYISDKLFHEYGVNRGLRDESGQGVLTGLTRISELNGFKSVHGKRVPIEGELWYRGYRISTLVDSLGKDELGFEKVAYLLLFGKMPTPEQLDEFFQKLGESRRLPTNFVRDVIMKAPTHDIMNMMTRSILTLASYDENVGDDSIANNIRQAIELIAVFPMLAIYSYHADNHYNNMQSMYIHRPDPSLSTAENFLRMLRPDSSYTQLEAKVLDTCLLLHMDHGGGNNSTFTTRVVTSTGSDTYSAIAAAMSSLKGPKHGGANIRVMNMMDDIRSHVSNYEDEEEVRTYLGKILDRQAFDGKGLIYGMGHAVYSLSDPRELILKNCAESLAKVKGRDKDMALYKMVEKQASTLIAEKRHIVKGVSPNVDFYSGFVYEMLDIPIELYTPLFAIARIVGWSAHRLEEIIGMGKIIRPAYRSIMEHNEK